MSSTVVGKEGRYAIDDDTDGAYDIDSVDIAETEGTSDHDYIDIILSSPKSISDIVDMERGRYAQPKIGKCTSNDIKHPFSGRDHLS